jgi:hypothetical protein
MSIFSNSIHSTFKNLSSITKAVPRFEQEQQMDCTLALVQTLAEEKTVSLDRSFYFTPYNKKA